MKIDIDKIPNYLGFHKKMVTPEIHTYIIWQLNQRGISQSLLAEVCGVSPAMINYIIMGKRKSEEVQLKIAMIFGFRSWNSLVCAAYEFQEERVYPGFKIKEVSNE